MLQYSMYVNEDGVNTSQHTPSQHAVRMRNNNTKQQGDDRDEQSIEQDDDLTPK